MSLRIMSLNAGRLLQPRTAEFLRALPGSDDSPDAICIQDLPLSGLPLFEHWPHVAYAPMTNHVINGVRGIVGNAIVSRCFMTDVTHHTVWGDGQLKDLEGINDQNQRHLGAESDRLVEATEDRVVTCATVIKGSEKYAIATTHGMWVRSGVPNDVQRDSTADTCIVLLQQAKKRKGLVLAADMNFDREGEVRTAFRRLALDCIPACMDCTLDPDHPFAKSGGKSAPDSVMVFPAFEGSTSYPYLVSDVRLRPGVSDHQALFATVTKKE